MSGFVRDAVALSELYRSCLGDDIARKMAHHAGRMAHHHHRYAVELDRIQKAAREIGIKLPTLDATKAPS